MHFTWGARQAASDAASKGEPEVDLVLFPGQATFSKLSGRRMFLLKYEKEEHFFWQAHQLCHVAYHFLIMLPDSLPLKGDDPSLVAMQVTGA